VGGGTYAHTKTKQPKKAQKSSPRAAHLKKNSQSAAIILK
jgi:hypothetical protein